MSAVIHIVRRINALDPQAIGATQGEDEPGAIPCLQFSELAQASFDQWRAQLETKIRSGKEHPALESHLAKYRSLVPSLALLIHLADRGSGPVGLDSLQRAITWGHYLETHARRIFAVAVNSDVAAATALAKRIQNDELTSGFTLRDVYRHEWSGLTTHGVAERATAVLCDLGWLHEFKQTTGGAPKRSFLINPRLHEKSASEGHEDGKKPYDPSSPRIRFRFAMYGRAWKKICEEDPERAAMGPPEDWLETTAE